MGRGKAMKIFHIYWKIDVKILLFMFVALFLLSFH